MLRQRLRLGGSTLATFVSRALVALLGAAIAWYGLMITLLALKVSPSFVNDISAYRTIFDYFAGLEPSSISGTARLITAAAALVLALIALLLLWRGRPHPHLARHSLELPEGDDGIGRTEIGPRAVERAVEAAALDHPSIVGARARYDDDGIVLSVTAKGAATLVETLHEVEDRAFESLEKHDLPLERVDVTLAGYDTANGRELA